MTQPHLRIVQVLSLWSQYFDSLQRLHHIQWIKLVNITSQNQHMKYIYRTSKVLQVAKISKIVQFPFYSLDENTQTTHTIKPLTSGIRVRVKPRHMLSLRFLTSGILTESVDQDDKLALALKFRSKLWNQEIKQCLAVAIITSECV